MPHLKSSAQNIRPDFPPLRKLTADNQGDLRSKLSLARLPMMPQVLVKLLELFHKEDVSLNEMAALISCDAGMVAKIMSFASSASLHGRTRPANLEQCLNLLGMNAVKVIVINESVLQVFSGFDVGRDNDLRGFWGHSLRCALIARKLASYVGFAGAEEAYLGGLLHDVGKLAMLATEARGYAELFHGLEDGPELCLREHERFGLTHADIGAWLIDRWELDSFLADSVLYHHEPVERVVSAHPLIRLVLLANRLSALHGQTPGREDRQVAALCGVLNGDLDRLLLTVETEVVELAKLLGIDLSAPAAVNDRVPGGPDDESRRLSIRLRDTLLVDRVLKEAVKAETPEAVLSGIALAVRVLFDVEPAIWFLPSRQREECYVASPIGARWQRAGQLEFQFGRSDSIIARALERGVAVVDSTISVHHVLDGQLQRMIGADGMLVLPLRSRRNGPGVLVAGIVGAARVENLRGRHDCLDHFGRAAAELLQKAHSAPAEESRRPLEADGFNRLVHEVSNPLAIISNYLSILETQCAEQGIGQPQLSIVRQEIERVGSILRSVRQPSLALENAPEPVDLNRVVDDMTALCRSSGSMVDSIDVQLELADALPTIVTNSDRLKQLLLNLIKNALEAMPNGGVLRVGTAPWGAGSGTSHLEIRVEDSGGGMPENVLSRLYQPVQSSKGGEHQGLGLAIVGQLVRELRGLINCRSDRTGTRFQVLLPLSEQ